jgi:hypothetical protein
MKWYVKFGNMNKLVSTGNQYAACVQTFKSFMKNMDAENEDGRNLPTFFSVSQKGFDKHDDDEIIETYIIAKVLEMSNLAKEKLAKLTKKNNKENKELK